MINLAGPRGAVGEPVMGEGLPNKKGGDAMSLKLDTTDKYTPPLGQ